MMLIPGGKRQETNGLGWDLLLASHCVLLLPFPLGSPFPPYSAADELLLLLLLSQTLLGPQAHLEELVRG